MITTVKRQLERSKKMTSLSFTNLRVYVDEKSHHMYSELTKGPADSAEDIPFIKMPDLFVAATCIGANQNKYKELTKKKDIFYADAFDSKVHLPVLIALAHKHLDDFEKLSDPRAILNSCEGWANGGIQILYEQLKTGHGLRPLYRLVDFVLNEANEN